ncbi:MAG: D-aminoacylase [Acidimicrobiia bacterium]|nr:D-aminoacylase [Acidimicrobiia bacterium]
MKADLLIAGGTVIDGTGTPPRAADVAVTGDRIAVVDPLPAGVEAATVLDATDRVVTPGFIDVHLHTDTAALAPDTETNSGLPSLRQGVTSEICGNCGFSPFPVSDTVADTLGDVLTAAMGEGARFFADVPAYRAALEERPLGPNYAPLAGHGALRMTAVGFDDRVATTDEIAEMCDALDAALAEGCFGMSTGLIYPPSMFAPTEEIVALAHVLARHGRLYTTHMRDEANRVDEAIDEALEIGRESGVPVQISHHKVVGRPNWGHSTATLERIDSARAGGLDVALDVYPYTASSTGLLALFPRWLLDGGLASVSRLTENETRDAVRAESRTAGPGARSALVDAPDTVVISAAAHHPDLEGHSLTEIAGDNGDPLDTACDLLVEDPGVQVIVHQMNEEDVTRILAHPLAVVGSDGGLGGGKPHPRRAGAFTRVLGRYVRDREALDLVEAVRKMTGAPAERFGLADRGVIATGRRADLVVFDPDTVRDGATYDDPLAPRAECPTSSSTAAS